MAEKANHTQAVSIFYCLNDTFGVTMAGTAHGNGDSIYCLSFSQQNCMSVSSRRRAIWQVYNNFINAFDLQLKFHANAGSLGVKSESQI